MLFEFIVEMITAAMSTGGYPILFILMTLESMIAPIPSEAVMPFAGFLAANGRFTFLGVILVSSLASVFGSLVSYWMGIFGGRRFILKFGKYLLLDEEHLQWTEDWFKRAGEKTIFISRFVPVVRHLISIPAGIGRMNLKKFIIYTFLGATLWNSFLAWLGFLLKERWEIIHHYSSQIDIVIVALLVIGISYFIYKLVKKTNLRKHQQH
ncbi:MAG: DedA family protein [Nanoarchaeota archaeon]|nr:DedA family protein [Nanoarchaeota archaeon]MBU4241669.1 DedA family protein [Nanoarchaeota archaeon]MBU4352152.1 DedA family protein [Nanoarchaeota archaeon]